MLDPKNIRSYGLTGLSKDVYAGIIVGIVAIPLGLAFAIASGVKPEYGLYTTIIAGFFISLFGGAKFQVSGPTGAFIPVLLAIVIQYGYENLLIAGFLSGILLIIMGVLRLGVLIKFIPRPVTIGFTAGIAVVIFTGQVANFLGLNVENHEKFYLNVVEIAKNITSINPYSLITAALGLVTILFTPKITKKIPSPIAGLVISTIVAYLFFGDLQTTIGSAYGGIPSVLPSFMFLDISYEKITFLLRPALVIAMLAAIESLLSAVVADGMTGSKHNSNKELIGQGIGNMIIPFFGGIPATGAIARTATNIKSGAVSKVSALIHALVVLIVLITFAPYASNIPLAGIAPILMVIAWNMSERKQFMHILKSKTADSLVLLTTFLLTLLTSLITAVEIGIILAVVLFVKRMAEMTSVTKVLPDHEHNKKLVPNMVYEGHDCPQLSIYTIEGPLFFGAASLFTKSIMEAINYRPKVLLLRMGRVPLIDTTGESNLRSIVNHFKEGGGAVLLTGLKKQPEEVLRNTGLYQLIGEKNIYNHAEEAISQALTKIDKESCCSCKYYAFKECSGLAKEPARVETKLAATR